MTTNFKEFTSMVDALILATNYITHDEAYIYYLVSRLNLNSLKFSNEVDGFNTEVAMTGSRNPSERNKILAKVSKKHINDIKAYVGKDDGKLEVMVVVEFSFVPTEHQQNEYIQQFKMFLNQRIEAFSELGIQSKLKVDTMNFEVEDNILASKITFRRFQ